MIYNEKIVDVLTGEEIIRPYTDAEITELNKQIAIIQAEQSQIEAEKIKKETAKNAVLNKLGLTTDEVTALLG